MTKLSVIIPCYNNGNYLKEMMDCCIRQTFKDWELIIVDDQSNDKLTHVIIKEYTTKDKRIKFFIRDREPKGSVTCRNIGFSHALGEYIIHFDADDLISTSCFENRIKFMETNPDCDYASFPANEFRNANELPSFQKEGAKYGIRCKGKDLLESFLKVNYSFSTWNNIYRKKSLENILWDENVKIYTDFAFIIAGIFGGLKHKFSELKELDYFYRVEHSKNAMTSSFVNSDKNSSTLRLFTNVLLHLSEKNNKELRKKQFLKFIILHFERMIFGGVEITDLNKYLNMIYNYYNFNIYLRFKIFVILYRYDIKNKYLYMFLETILFFEKKYLKSLYNKLS